MCDNTETANLVAAVENMVTRQEAVIEAVNAIGTNNQYLVDSVNRIMAGFADVQGQMTSIGPATLIRNLLGGGGKHGK